MRRLWYNGTVASMDGAMRRYEAVGAEDGRLTFLGSVQEALAQVWDETRDLQGGMVLPGFTDSHMHLLHYAMIQKNLSLFGVASIGEIIDRGRARIERDHPSYLIGMGWNQETMAEGRLVTREDLDRISTDIPVCMLRTCLHIGACNSIMLERIRALEDVAPEVLALVDFANGILREDAARLYMKVLPQADDAYVKELIRLGQRDLNAAGITCVNSDDLKAIAGVDPIRLIGIFREMEADGELTVRVYEQCLVEPEDFERLQAVRSDPADRESLFRTGPRKLLQDGSLGAKSAEMIDGYLDEPDNHGIPIYTEEELCSRIRAAHTAHMDVAVHAIGDLAFRKVCDAIEWVEREEPWPDHRHGIVHAQTTTPALLERMKALGLQAYIQPIFIDADMNIIAERVGEATRRNATTGRPWRIWASGSAAAPTARWSPSTCWTTCAPPSPGRTGRAPGSTCPSRPSRWSRPCGCLPPMPPGPAGMRLSAAPWSWASRPTLWCWTGICLKSLTKTLIGLRFWRRC